MADATAGVTAAEKSPDRIEREMEQTRESITAKVSALENQVLGTIQTATTTISDTVQAVKDTVTTAPTAMKESVQETVAAVKDSVKETFASVRESVASFNLGECVGNNPGTALGASVVTGFVTGLVLFGERQPRAVASRGPGDTMPREFAPAGYPAAPARPGLLGGLWAMVGGEVEQLARQALSTALASLKESVNRRVPGLMDDAVQTLTNRVTGQNGAAHAGYTPAPAAGL